MHFKQNIRLQLNFIGSISPKYLKFSLLRATTTSALSVLEIILFTLLVNIFTSNSNYNGLKNQIVISIITISLLSLLKNWLTYKLGIIENSFHSLLEQRLYKLKLDLPYQKIDDPQLNTKRENILKSLFATDNGIDTFVAHIEKFTNSFLTSVRSIVFVSRPMYYVFNVNIFWGVIILSTAILVVDASIKNGDNSQRKIFELYRKGSQHNSYTEYYNNDYLESESANKDIRIYNQASMILDEIMEKSRVPWMNIVVGKHSILRKHKGSNSILTNIFKIELYGVLGIIASSGLISVSLLFQSIMAFEKISLSFISLFAYYKEIKGDIFYNDALLEYIDEVSIESQITKDKYKIDLSKGLNFEFDSVYFKYPGADNDTLIDINLKIKNGDLIALVGENGMGKSTFIKLLCRLLKPTKGAIYLNGINIQDYDESYEELFSAIFQDFLIFSFSIKENIVMNQYFEKERFDWSLKQIGMYEKIQSLPFKEDTYINKNFCEYGTGFSGGELQKLAICRGIYKEAQVFVLDEPTSAFDAISEQNLYEKLARDIKPEISIYISHRLSSCKNCNNIIVLHDGMIVERGEHSILLNKKGKYYELWKLQAKHYVS